MGGGVKDECGGRNRSQVWPSRQIFLQFEEKTQYRIPRERARLFCNSFVSRG